MFGINDNNQNDKSQTVNDKPADSPLPPTPGSVTGSPFDNSVPASPSPEPSSAPAIANEPSIATPAVTQDNDLVGLKEQALNSLAPLVNHLDQTPEEKFKTTMMLIQASDNSNLVKEAYEAANQITDEKTRAQALLDVVNEINYFTQKNKGEEKV